MQEENNTKSCYNFDLPHLILNVTRLHCNVWLYKRLALYVTFIFVAKTCDIMKLSLKALQCIVWSGYDDKAMSAGLSRQQMRSTFARPQNTSRGNKLHYYIVPL